MDNKFLEGTFEISFFFFFFLEASSKFFKSTRMNSPVSSYLILFTKNVAEDESEIEQARAKIVCVSITAVDFLI